MAQVIAFLKIIQDGILPYQNKESISTTNFLFRLHTKYTSTTVIITGVLLFIQQLFVDHLKCFRPGSESTPLDVGTLNQYCYATTGTYANHTDKSGTNYQFQHYFQWVPYILMVQGIFLFVPQLVWKTFVENGRMERFCAISVKSKVGEQRSHSEPQLATVGTGAAGDSAAPENDANKKGVKILSISFAQTLKSTSNKTYFWGFAFCELLNVVFVIICFFVTDWLIHGSYAGLGVNWVAYLQKLRDLTYIDAIKEMELEEKIQSLENPLEIAFPTMFICRWDKGNSLLMDGHTEPIPEFKYKVSCVMGLNIIHQRIYLVFWFGFVILITASIVNFFYTIVLCMSKSVRLNLATKEAQKKGIQDTPELREIFCKMSCYDWFVLKKILRNVDSQRFDAICDEIREMLNGTSSFRRNSFGNKGGLELEVIRKDTGTTLELEPIKAINL